MRICVIGTSASCHVLQRTRVLADLGHEVTLVTPQAVGLAGVEELAPRPNPFPRGPLCLLGACGRLWQYYRLIRSAADRADVVHLHYAGGWRGWLTLLSGVRPLAVSSMGGDILFDQAGAVCYSERWLTAELCRRADLVTCKSPVLAGVLRGMGVPDERIMTLVWGVDLDEFRHREADDLRRRLGLGPKERVILSPRQLQPFYNIHLIVEALPRVLARHPDTTLLVTEYNADTDYRDALVGLADRLGVGQRVRFAGRVDQAEMPQWYSLADVVVHAPPSDGVPQALIEAMACETPNVLGRLEAYGRTVQDDESAVLADLSAEGLAEGMLRLFDDPALRERIACRGRAIVEAQANLRTDVRRLERRLVGLAASGGDGARRIASPGAWLHVLAASLFWAGQLLFHREQRKTVRL